MKEFLFRLYTGWLVSDPLVCEAKIRSINYEEAYKNALVLANGRAFTLNEIA